MLQVQIMKNMQKKSIMNAKNERPTACTNAQKSADGTLDQELELLWQDGAPPGASYDRKR
jgi:hypothetical protein